jgi:carboxylesterase type B
MRSSTFSAALFFAGVHGQAWQVGQPVKTTSGTIVGHASSWKNQVSEYLGVPFAKPPVGDLRWAPPAAITDSSKTVNATQYVYLPITLMSSANHETVGIVR